MLVLTRKKFERVLIRCQDGSAVWVTVVSVGDGKVRLGFDADRGVTIDREEVAAEKYVRTPDPALIAGYYYAAPTGGQP